MGFWLLFNLETSYKVQQTCLVWFKMFLSKLAKKSWLVIEKLWVQTSQKLIHHPPANLLTSGYSIRTVLILSVWIREIQLNNHLVTDIIYMFNVFNKGEVHDLL